MILQGDCIEKLKELPEKSINMCMTSPPYWALRDYGVNGQLGLEPTFDEYINKLCDIFDEVKRVLRDDGTCWVNLGDSYYGSGKGAGGDISKSKEVYTFKEKEKRTCDNCGKDFQGWKFQNFCGSACSGVDNTPREKKGKMQDKCLVGIPMRFAVEMVNRGWILRNTIIWHKPNCMPSSVKDRFTVDFEYIFFFSKKKKYYFETQYEPLAQSTLKDKRYEKASRGEYVGGKPIKDYGKSGKGVQVGQDVRERTHQSDLSKGRNKRTIWKIKPKPFKEAHFAVYPEELCQTPIKAGCPEFVCKKCGSPKVLDLKYTRYETRPNKNSKYSDDVYVNSNKPKGLATRTMSDIINNGYKSTCDCNAGFEGGIVLDPFFGAGTTGVVALKQNKKYIGIELNPEYIKIAEARINKIKEQKQ